MKAVELLRTRIAFSEHAFAELVLWHVPRPVAGSTRGHKYRLAYVVNGACVVRYDSESEKGDHRHFAGKEGSYAFKSPDKLIANFQRDVARWNDEDSDS